MLAAIAIALFSIFLLFIYPPLLAKYKSKPKRSPRYEAQMRKLWTIAQESMASRKPLRAEKALLTILKFDERNAAAYNRLGILYAKEQKYTEAIECFEIAQSLDNNPSTLHNVGLIYLETEAYEKAAMALERALELEGGVASRYLALAKALEKLGRRAEAIDALESAYELEASTSILRQILALYEAAGDTEGIESTKIRINNQLAALEKKQRPVSVRRPFVRRDRPGVNSAAPVNQGAAGTKTAATPSRFGRPHLVKKAKPQRLKI